MSAASTVASNCVNIENCAKTFCKLLLMILYCTRVRFNLFKFQQQQSIICQTWTSYLTVLAGDRVPVALIFVSPASVLLEKCSLFSVLEMSGPSTARPVVTELGL